MSLYKEYLKEIEVRKAQGLHPKPIEDGSLIEEIVLQIKDLDHKDRSDSLSHLIYNTLPGTTSAAAGKAQFLEEIVSGKTLIKEINRDFALELLSHMKGGPSVAVLLNLAFNDDLEIAKMAVAVLKTQVYLYEADTNRITEAYEAGNKIAQELLESYVRAEFFTKLPDVEEERSKLLLTLQQRATFLRTFFRQATKPTRGRIGNCTVNALYQNVHRKKLKLLNFSILTSV